MRKGKIKRPAASVRLLVTLAAFWVCVLLAGCERGASPNAKRYELKGKVVHVDQRGNTVTIAHEEIRDYMQPMTMAFKLKDPWPLKEMQQGDSVSAVLVVDGSRSWLEEVVFSRIDASQAGGGQASHGPQIGDEVP
ncbi:MAG TPA: copper-binding protein, partial [Blastocatellia bacterium]|nr:copper-binding protein [Blastocatellia bacterium]